MQKIELTISPDYVPSWTYVDAVRELFQNALDQEYENDECKAEWKYNSNTETLTISNTASTLTTSSLLLGKSTKASNSSVIGQFGEGYKIATLVLLREGKNIVFYNYGAKEIWRPRFVKSRRFGTDILTFFIEKKPAWAEVPFEGLTVAIEHIAPYEYEEIKKTNLHLRDDYNIVEHTEYGDVIDLPGRVFINGLYVCDYEPYMYGYNFKPQYLQLDRDRKMVNDFDLKWLSSKMWSGCNDTNKVMQLVVSGVPDVAYLKCMYNRNIDWSSIAVDLFKDTYGPDAVPVTSQEELENVPNGYKGIIVNECYSTLIKSSLDFIMPEPDAASPIDKLHEWFDAVRDKLTEEEINQFEDIVEELNQ